MSNFDPEVYNDEKVKITLDMLSEGKSKDEIAAHFGHSWAGVDQHFRRKGFRWNGVTFIPKTETLTAAEEARFMTTKAAQIVRTLSQKHTNIKQVANKNGFTTVDEMGEYMKSQGYVWKQAEGNYEYDETLALEKAKPAPQKVFSQTLTIAGLEEYQDFLQYLLSKKERLFTLLETESDGTLPRYKFKGAKANKTLGLPTTVQALLNDFSKEFNVTQRDIIEVALAEFFKKYGYEDQLNSVLQA